MNLFEPSASRAREYRAAMDEDLWASVQKLLPEFGVLVPATTAPSYTAFLDYAAYFDLALVPPTLDEVPQEAKARAVRHLTERLARPVDPISATSHPRIANFSTDHFESATLDQMRRWWDVDPQTSLDMTPATDEQCEMGKKNIDRALDVLRSVSPELHGEFEVVIGDIVLSRPDASKSSNYSGVSSLALWGALTINPELQSTWLQMYRHLVHEEGHNALFAIAGDKALVADDPKDRHMSPIRPDPRPTDGIFHAAFVSAREALSLDQLLEHHETDGCLSEAERETAEAMLKTSVLAFVDCAELLRTSAQLTDFGNRVLEDCESFMSANFMVD